ncbi:MAG: iron-containing alcohol dehydrogenase [Caldilineaceae bacterium]|nr:iron-containing alcohol dehydrogenase [Caldilineaceae bacterium]
MSESMVIWPLPTVQECAFADWSEERPITVVTTAAAWAAVQPLLAHLTIAAHIEVTDADIAAWQAFGTAVQGQAIYAVGGGLAVDAAKFLSGAHELPLICMPTVLSVDAFFTWASGVRENGCVRYIVTRPPDLVIMDYAVLAAAPPSIRAAGICDVLSIATGSWDWRFAEAEKRNPPNMRYAAWADRMAATILDAALECAEAAGQGERAGLKQLADCLALEVQLCNQLGHSCAEEEASTTSPPVENVLGKGLAHGDLVDRASCAWPRRRGRTLPCATHSGACIPLDRIPPTVVEQTLWRCRPT